MSSRPLARILLALPAATVPDGQGGIMAQQRHRFNDAAALMALGDSDSVKAAKALLEDETGLYSETLRQVDLEALRKQFLEYVASVYNLDGRNTLWMGGQANYSNSDNIMFWGPTGQRNSRDTARVSLPVASLYAHSDHPDIWLRPTTVLYGASRLPGGAPSAQSSPAAEAADVGTRVNFLISPIIALGQAQDCYLVKRGIDVETLTGSRIVTPVDSTYYYPQYVTPAGTGVPESPCSGCQQHPVEPFAATGALNHSFTHINSALRHDYFTRPAPWADGCLEAILKPVQSPLNTNSFDPRYQNLIPRTSSWQLYGPVQDLSPLWSYLPANTLFARDPRSTTTVRQYTTVGNLLGAPTNLLQGLVASSYQPMGWPVAETISTDNAVAEVILEGAQVTDLGDALLIVTRMPGARPREDLQRNVPVALTVGQRDQLNLSSAYGANLATGISFTIPASAPRSIQEVSWLGGEWWSFKTGRLNNNTVAFGALLGFDYARRNTPLQGAMGVMPPNRLNVSLKIINPGLPASQAPAYQRNQVGGAFVSGDLLGVRMLKRGAETDNSRYPLAPFEFLQDAPGEGLSNCGGGYGTFVPLLPELATTLPPRLETVQQSLEVVSALISGPGLVFGTEDPKGPLLQLAGDGYLDLYGRQVAVTAKEPIKLTRVWSELYLMKDHPDLQLGTNRPYGEADTVALWSILHGYIGFQASRQATIQTTYAYLDTQGRIQWIAGHSAVAAGIVEERHRVFQAQPILPDGSLADLVGGRYGIPTDGLRFLNGYSPVGPFGSQTLNGSSPWLVGRSQQWTIEKIKSLDAVIRDDPNITVRVFGCSNLPAANGFPNLFDLSGQQYGSRPGAYAQAYEKVGTSETATASVSFRQAVLNVEDRGHFQFPRLPDCHLPCQEFDRTLQGLTPAKLQFNQALPPHRPTNNGYQEINSDEGCQGQRQDLVYWPFPLGNSLSMGYAQGSYQSAVSILREGLAGPSHPAHMSGIALDSYGGIGALPPAYYTACTPCASNSYSTSYNWKTKLTMIGCRPSDSLGGWRMAIETSPWVAVTTTEIQYGPTPEAPSSGVSIGAVSVSNLSVKCEGTSCYEDLNCYFDGGGNYVCDSVMVCVPTSSAQEYYPDTPLSGGASSTEVVQLPVGINPGPVSLADLTSKYVDTSKGPTAWNSGGVPGASYCYFDSSTALGSENPVLYRWPQTASGFPSFGVWYPYSLSEAPANTCRQREASPYLEIPFAYQNPYHIGGTWHPNNEIPLQPPDGTAPEFTLGMLPLPYVRAVALPAYRPMLTSGLISSALYSVRGAPCTFGGLSTWRTLYTDIRVGALRYWLKVGEVVNFAHAGGTIRTALNLNPGVGTAGVQKGKAQYTCVAPGLDTLIITDVANGVQAHVEITVFAGELAFGVNPLGTPFYVTTGYIGKQTFVPRTEFRVNNSPVLFNSYFSPSPTAPSVISVMEPDYALGDVPSTTPFGPTFPLAEPPVYTTGYTATLRPVQLTFNKVSDRKYLVTCGYPVDMHVGLQMSERGIPYASLASTAEAQSQILYVLDDSRFTLTTQDHITWTLDLLGAEWPERILQANAQVRAVAQLRGSMDYFASLPLFRLSDALAP